MLSPVFSVAFTMFFPYNKIKLIFIGDISFNEFINDLAKDHIKLNKNLTSKKLFHNKKFRDIFENFNQIIECKSVKEAAEIIKNNNGGKLSTYSIYLKALVRDGLIDFNKENKLLKRGKQLLEIIDDIGFNEIQELVIYNDNK